MRHTVRMVGWLTGLSVVLGCAGAAACAVLHVPAQYPTLQAAVDASAPGDTVLVAPGTYTGVGNRGVDFGGKDIALVGEAGPEATIIDCQQADRGIRLHHGETRAAVVAGFTIKGGYLPQTAGGGAICCEGASPTLRDLVLQGNSASSGGALACVGGSEPDVSSCVMTGNTAHYRHGGAVLVQDSAPVIRDCVMSGNSASYRGGAMWIDGCTGVELTDVTMTGNYSSTLGGGALCIEESTDATFTGCEFSDNASYSFDGGGAFVRDSGDVRFEGCLFTDNHTRSDRQGGGVYAFGNRGMAFDDCRFIRNRACYGGGLLCDSGYNVFLSSCVFSDNRAYQDGGAISCWISTLSMTECTLVANTAYHAGGGVDCYWHSSPSITRCLIAFTRDGGAVDCDNSNGACQPVLDCCDIYGNGGGDWVGYIAEQYGLRGNLSVDPLFCDPEFSGVSLCANSPCLPGNHPQGAQCGTIGAAGAGCGPCGPVAVERTSWGHIKSLYR